MLNKAIEIATKAYEGQVDKAVQPYIDHLLRVMAMGRKNRRCVHDVVEDSDWTFERLTVEGFYSEIVDALR